MIDINFRREPIYLPDNRLDEPAYFKYKIATQRIPSLRLLRSLYIGRVIHTSTEQWKNDVMDLLKFNVKTQDDSQMDKTKIITSYYIAISNMFILFKTLEINM